MFEHLPAPVGRALRHVRPGLDKLLVNDPSCSHRESLAVLSRAFDDGAPLPMRYTADGEGLSPPLHWSGVPEGAASLALIVEDADAPTGEPLVHAIVVDLTPADESLSEGALSSAGHEGQHMHEGRNSYLRSGWLPPDPPPGHGEHRYAFQMFALGPGEPFKGTPGRDDLLQAIQERGLASGMTMATYTRPDGTIKAQAPQVVVAPTE